MVALAGESFLVAIVAVDLNPRQAVVVGSESVRRTEHALLSSFFEPALTSSYAAGLPATTKIPAEARSRMVAQRSIRRRTLRRLEGNDVAPFLRDFQSPSVAAKADPFILHEILLQRRKLAPDMRRSLPGSRSLLIKECRHPKIPRIFRDARIRR